MRKYLIPLTIAATLGASGAALAATTTGTVASISPLLGTVTLTDGSAYTFDLMHAGALSNFTTGDKVTIDYAGGGTDAFAISPRS
jgi:hypothetical protein